MEPLLLIFLTLFVTALEGKCRVMVVYERGRFVIPSENLSFLYFLLNILWLELVKDVVLLRIL